MRTRLLICAALVAIIGFSAALVIYLRAPDDESDDVVVVVGGKTFRYPITSTKAYQRDLQRAGGNAAVLFDDVERWIRGRWHGRALGVTLAWITGIVSLALFLVAREVGYYANAKARADTPSG